MEKKVAIVGIGYVGLPLAELCAKKGYHTYGIDIDRKKVDLANKGINFIDQSPLKSNIIATDDFSVIRECDTVVVCVPTPVNHDKTKDLKPLLNAARSIYPHLKKGHLVVIESTVNPNAIEEEVLPILAASGLKEGRNFFVSHCPERI